MTSQNKKNIAFCLVIAAVALLAFYPCLYNSFVNWDDPELLTENPAVRSFSPANIAGLFGRFYCGTYIPLTLLSFALEYRLFQDDALPYHAVNIFLHIVNGLLVLWFISKITGDPWTALVTALVFAVHPLRVESVAWIAERKDVLFALFYLLSLIAYVGYARRPRAALYLVSLLCFLLSLLAKSVAFTLPFILLLIDGLEGRRLRSMLVNKLPYLALAAAFAVIAVLAQHTLPGHSFPLLKNLFIMSYVLLFYVIKTAMPVGLSPLYPFPASAASQLPLSFWLAPLGLVIAAAAVALAGRRSRMPAFGCLFFLIAILPVMQFVPVAGPEMAANRYTYVPSIGLILAFSCGLVWLYRKAVLPPVKTGVVSLAVIMIVLLSAVTWRRCAVWRDSFTLWSAVIEKYPDFPHAYAMRAQAHAAAGRPGTAIADYTRALRVNPWFKAALHGRGNLLLKQDDYAGAIDDFTQLLEVDQRSVDAYVNRGNAYSAMGRVGPALDDYERALAIEPGNSDALYNRAVVYFLTGDLKRARYDVDRLLEAGYPVKPEFLEALQKGRLHSR